MTLDEAIARLNGEHRHEFVLEPGQLTGWLTELKKFREVYSVVPCYEMCIPECKEGYDAQISEYKRLLKAAVEALNDGSCNKDCRQCENHKSCDYDNRFKWKHTEEAMKLIEEEEK